MSQTAKEFLDIIGGELGACPDRTQVLSRPTLEDNWIHGVGSGLKIRMDDDLTWWFLKAFAPTDYPLAKRVFDAVPRFWFDLAQLGSTPAFIDWNLVHYLRRYLLRAIWPTSYQIATGATTGKAAEVSAMIRRLQTEESWRTR